MRRKADEADTWNIFVQILTPLIIVLSFVAMIEIARFKQGFDERGEMVERLRTNLSPTDKEREHELELIDLQRQKLLLALDVVVASRREALGFGRVPNAGVVGIDAPAVKDEAFKALCRNMRRIGSDGTFEKRMLEDVMAKAGVRDAARFDPQPGYQADHLTGRNVITLNNRNYLRERIGERVAALRLELQGMQQQVLSRIFHALMARPEALDAKTSALSRKVIDPAASVADQAEAARTLVRYLNDRIRAALAQDGYEFLEKTWQSIDI